MAMRKIARIDEDPEERAAFDRAVKTIHSGYSAIAVMSGLLTLSRANPPEGALSKLLAIYANEIAGQE